MVTGKMHSPGSAAGAGAPVWTLNPEAEYGEAQYGGTLRGGAPSASPHPRLLIVDNQEISRRLLRAMFKSSHYEIFECRKASEAIAVLDRERIDLVVLDLVLPEISGAELCRWLKGNRATQLIPLLMLTSVHGVENEIAGISSGADEFLIKPVNPTVFRTRVRAMLRNKALIDSLEQAETILFALAQAVEQRDRYTGMHCQRLAAYSLQLGEALNLTAPDMTTLYRGGFLHDIGKISIADAILFKNGPLTEQEWVAMRSHTVIGEQICRPMKSLAPVLPIIRNHHEKWDGTGYPDGLRGNDIPLLARILQMADIYDALTTERPYKPAYPREEAFAIMEQEASRGWRDPELVKLFVSVAREHGTEGTEMAAMQTSLGNMRRQLAG